MFGVIIQTLALTLTYFNKIPQQPEEQTQSTTSMATTADSTGAAGAGGGAGAVAAAPATTTTAVATEPVEETLATSTEGSKEVQAAICLALHLHHDHHTTRLLVVCSTGNRTNALMRLWERWRL